MTTTKTKITIESASFTVKGLKASDEAGNKLDVKEITVPIGPIEIEQDGDPFIDALEIGGMISKMVGDKIFPTKEMGPIFLPHNLPITENGKTVSIAEFRPENGWYTGINMAGEQSGLKHMFREAQIQELIISGKVMVGETNYMIPDFPAWSEAYEKCQEDWGRCTQSKDSGITQKLVIPQFDLQDEAGITVATVDEFESRADGNYWVVKHNASSLFGISSVELYWLLTTGHTKTGDIGRIQEWEIVDFGSWREAYDQLNEDTRDRTADEPRIPSPDYADDCAEFVGKGEDFNVPEVVLELVPEDGDNVSETVTKFMKLGNGNWGAVSSEIPSITSGQLGRLLGFGRARVFGEDGHTIAHLEIKDFDTWVVQFEDQLNAEDDNGSK